MSDDPERIAPPAQLRRYFSVIAGSYQRVNHLFTFGMDILWRRKAVSLALEPGIQRCLDVCAGTGETAGYLFRNSPSAVSVTALDFSLPMLRELRNKKDMKTIPCLQAEAGSMPFPDNTFDLVTVSFATRNLDTPPGTLHRVLAEIYRVLKPGGKFVNLESSKPRAPVIRHVFQWYVRRIVPLIGKRFSGAPESYQYLQTSVLRFYTPEELAELLREAGFRRVVFHRLFFGAACVHLGFREREA